MLLLLCGMAALAAPLAAAPSALAGTYQFSADTTQDIDSWTLTKTTAYYGCRLGSRPGVCADADVPLPTPLRIFAYGLAATDSEASWSWVAPPTVSIADGSVTVDYHTSSYSRVFMKARLRSGSFGSQPQLHTASDDGTATWSIPAGNEAVGIYLKTITGHNYADKWQNYITVLSLDATLRDDTAPTGSLSGPLAAGQWLNQSQPVCLTVNAADAGAGVASSQLRDALGVVLDRHDVQLQAASQPGLTDYTDDLCLTPSALSDGEHALTVRVADAAGEQVELPASVSVDAHAPTVLSALPAGSTTDRRSPISFSVDAGASGLASLQAELDGQPMSVLGATASYQPAADLAYGQHTVTWSASDAAGNHRDAFWTFVVVDSAPPTLSYPLPADGDAFEARRPVVSFDLADAGSGIDPATLRVLLDGIEVAPFGSLVGGSFAFQPADDLGFGHHVVNVAVSDREGNAMPPVRWSFDVVDGTAPVLSDVRPDDGASGPDRTPPISFAVADDGGSGVDADSITLLLDGVDVTAGGSFAGGRFAYTPVAPLGFGVHTLSAGAADRAGNRSAALTWRFEVRDETPPVVAGLLPAAGSTVAGATVIGFDVSDLGSGIDDATLSVMVDGSDVAGWGSLSGGRFRYAPGNLGAGVHTIAVTVSDRAGNGVGPVMWQFAVADPARISLTALTAPAQTAAGQQVLLRFAALSNGTALAGAQVLVSSREAGQPAFTAGRLLTAGVGGEIAWPVAPLHTTTYRVELASDAAVAVEHTIAVRQLVSLSASRLRVQPGSSIRLSGRVIPAQAGMTVRIQLLTSRGWVTVALPRLSAGSAFTKTLLPRVRGRYVFRVTAPATAQNVAGVSRSITVRVG
ncbi:MAG: large repetitive protein [Gaiellales bacterium]|nr:large repetitive protein [Gaiellales bacterium]